MTKRTKTVIDINMETLKSKIQPQQNPAGEFFFKPQLCKQIMMDLKMQSGS